jgi:hypothetical protein
MSNEYFHIGLGKLWVNFLSLDAVLRVFLGKVPGAAKTGLPYGTDIYSMPVGTELPITAISKLEYLSDLLESYNREVVSLGVGSPIEPSLVELRNSIAHGFVSTDVNEGPMRLLKFQKSKPGHVKIAVNEFMDEAWLTKQNKRIFDAIHIVAAAAAKLDKKP